MALGTPLTWSVVIPVKVLALAKSRLAGLDTADRRALALAMAVDTVAAAVASPLVGAVVVVTDDRAVTSEVAPLGAVTVADTPGAGLNRALITGAEHAAARWPGYGLAALLADLPALTAAELTAALAAASAVTQAYMADAAGTGTTCTQPVRRSPFPPASVRAPAPGTGRLARSNWTRRRILACARTWTPSRICAVRPRSAWAAAQLPWRPSSPRRSVSQPKCRSAAMLVNRQVSQ